MLMAHNNDGYNCNTDLDKHLDAQNHLIVIRIHKYFIACQRSEGMGEVN